MNVPHEKLPHPFTRRTFIKASTFAAGSMVLMSRGTALADATSAPSFSDTYLELDPIINSESTEESSASGTLFIKQHRVHNGQPGVLEETLEIDARWIFSQSLIIPTDAQDDKIKTDCCRWTVANVTCALEIYNTTLGSKEDDAVAAILDAIWPSVDGSDPGVIPGPTFTRGITVTDVSPNATDLKVDTGTLIGDTDRTHEGIKIVMKGTVTPENVGPTRTIEWKSSPTFNKDQFNLDGKKTAVKVALEAEFPGTGTTVYVVDTSGLPLPSATDYWRSNSFHAEPTNDDVVEGNACPTSFPTEEQGGEEDD